MATWASHALWGHLVGFWSTMPTWVPHGLVHAGHTAVFWGQSSMVLPTHTTFLLGGNKGNYCNSCAISKILKIFYILRFFLMKNLNLVWAFMCHTVHAYHWMGPVGFYLQWAHMAPNGFDGNLVIYFGDLETNLLTDVSVFSPVKMTVGSQNVSGNTAGIKSVNLDIHKVYSYTV